MNVYTSFRGIKFEEILRTSNKLFFLLIQQEKVYHEHNHGIFFFT